MKLEVETKAWLWFAAFLLVLAAAGLAWYFLAASHYATYQVYTADSVSGLMVDAPIEFHGVEVGKVKAVRLVDPHRVRVVLSIEKAVPVSSATVATIVSRGVAARGFTGYVYVSLEDDGPGELPIAARPDEPYPVIRSAPSEVMTLDTAMRQINGNVQATADLLHALLDKKTVGSLREAIVDFQKAAKVLADNSARLDSIFATADRASRRIGPLIESSQGAVTSLQDAGKRMGPLLESSQATLDRIQTQILPQAAKALADVDAMSGSLNDLANKIGRNPTVLIRGTQPARPAPGEQK